MSKFFTENLGLKLFALGLAVIIVLIKAQEKIFTRFLPNVAVMLDNRPANLLLPERWSPPLVRVMVQGPRNTIDLIRPEQSFFRIDMGALSDIHPGNAVTIVMNESMFRTNLERDDRDRIFIDDESIRPRQISLRVLEWNIDQDKPALPTSEILENQVEIPLFLAEKEVSIHVPLMGTAPITLRFDGYTVTPPVLRLTGRMEALAQIQSVSTMALDLSGIKADTLPIYLPLQSLGREYEVWPVQDDIRDVTVVLKIQKQKS